MKDIVGIENVFSQMNPLREGELYKIISKDTNNVGMKYI